MPSAGWWRGWRCGREGWAETVKTHVRGSPGSRTGQCACEVQLAREVGTAFGDSSHGDASRWRRSNRPAGVLRKWRHEAASASGAGEVGFFGVEVMGRGVVNGEWEMGGGGAEEQRGRCGGDHRPRQPAEYIARTVRPHPSGQPAGAGRNAGVCRVAALLQAVWVIARRFLRNQKLERDHSGRNFKRGEDFNKGFTLRLFPLPVIA